jgi:signal transduction histidine kinase
VEAAGPAARARSISIDTTLDPAPTAGDPVLVERLVTNLVDNAVRHNVPGGSIDVRTGTSGGCALLRVANTGPAVPADQVDRLLQPFQRLAPDRAGQPSDGLGMGLSIVAAIASAHDATVAVRPGTSGGLIVEVRFPFVGNAEATATISNEVSVPSHR